MRGWIFEGNLPQPLVRVHHPTGMLFHSQAFVLLFLPAFLATYYSSAGNTCLREWIVIGASAIFYAWWDVRFLPLLIGQVAIGWMISQAYFNTRRRWLLGFGVALNLLALALFKYLDFLTGIVGSILGRELPPAGIVLPIGISFFTFQIASYLIDVQRGEAPRYPFRRFALFIMLFPHLIAGPIVRHNEIIPQFDADPRRDGLAERLVRGVTLFAIGFLMKVVIADGLAPHADRIFAAAGTAPQPFLAAWFGALAFALQIFFDFAAYSEMAMGLAMMMGLTFPMNFAMPYRATSLRDFWRRWHMSLSRFLRDYLYVPLGGSRHGFARFAFATLLTMGLCGLWHGAGWPFVIWGLVHGIGLIICRAWQTRCRPLPDWLGWGLTFTFAVAAFVPFRAPDLATTTTLLAGMGGFSGLGAMPDGRALIMLTVAFALALVRWPNPELLERYFKPHPALAVATAAGLAWGVLHVGRGAPSSFIYFQF